MNLILLFVIFLYAPLPASGTVFIRNDCRSLINCTSSINDAIINNENESVFDIGNGYWTISTPIKYSNNNISFYGDSTNSTFITFDENNKDILCKDCFLIFQYVTFIASSTNSTIPNLFSYGTSYITLNNVDIIMDILDQENDANIAVKWIFNDDATFNCKYCLFQDIELSNSFFIFNASFINNVTFYQSIFLNIFSNDILQTVDPFYSHSGFIEIIGAIHLFMDECTIYDNDIYPMSFIFVSNDGIETNSNYILEINNSIFVNNIGGWGTILAVYRSTSYLFITSCNFTNNIGDIGGCIDAWPCNECQVIITNSKWTNNIATSYGGGIVLVDAVLE